MCQGLRGIWAPDVSYFANAYHLYYSVSTFGSNRSSIGLATNKTLDPGSDQYRWMDQGRVVSSSQSDDWNAIDPNVVMDESGQPWLSFGSFWSGIKLRKLDASSRKARRKRSDTVFNGSSAAETLIRLELSKLPFIILKNGFYYLFVSFDFCCRGPQSTYNIRVGRAKKVTGPYVDRSGKDMREGGGTLVLEGEGRWRGPGHCAVLQEKDGIS